jgi:hypothetical protein
MIIQKCIPLDSSSEWKEALRGIKHAFAHTWENCYAMHLTTGLRTYLYRFESEYARIVCPIAERTFDNYIDIVTPYGFSGFVGDGDCSEFSHHWNGFVKEREYVCGYIGLNPLFANSTHFKREERVQYNSIYVLDLTLSHHALFMNLSVNRKRQLKEWDKTLAGIILDRERLSDFFLTNHAKFFRQKNASPVYCFSQETLSFLTGLDNVLIVGLGVPERIEAVTLFAHTPHVGDFLFNVSLPEGRRHSVALLWYGVNYLKSIGVPFLNLGGGVSENDTLARFKERFGGVKLPLKSLKQIYEPEIYEKLCRQVNVDHADMSGYFPAYRRPEVMNVR